VNKNSIHENVLVNKLSVVVGGVMVVFDDQVVAVEPK